MLWTSTLAPARNDNLASRRAAAWAMNGRPTRRASSPAAMTARAEPHVGGGGAEPLEIAHSLARGHGVAQKNALALAGQLEPEVGGGEQRSRRAHMRRLRAALGILGHAKRPWVSAPIEHRGHA